VLQLERVLGLRLARTSQFDDHRGAYRSMNKVALRRCGALVILAGSLSGCMPFSAKSTPTPAALSIESPAPPIDTPAAVASSAPSPHVPNFDHIVIVVFENQEFDNVIGNPLMPTFNKLADEYTLLTQYYAVAHPSLPNYIALLGGDTFGIDSDCGDCFVDAASLPDLIEASGRTWKTYQEDIPKRCYVGDAEPYFQRHNPFIYFDRIRLNAGRCRDSVVPLDRLQKDIDNGALPNFIFITPNECNDAHECPLNVADAWLGDLLGSLSPALDAAGPSYLLVFMFEEGDGNGSCCGLPPEAGGRVAVVLDSPLAKSGFKDATPYTHYSLLKTISTAWGLPLLGHAADDSESLITAPWK
jgi:phosphatidylinositol-3-phosphatase